MNYLTCNSRPTAATGKQPVAVYYLRTLGRIASRTNKIVQIFGLLARLVFYEYIAQKYFLVKMSDLGHISESRKINDSPAQLLLDVNSSGAKNVAPRRTRADLSAASTLGSFDCSPEELWWPTNLQNGLLGHYP